MRGAVVPRERRRRRPLPPIHLGEDERVHLVPHEEGAGAARPGVERVTTIKGHPLGRADHLRPPHAVVTLHAPRVRRREAARALKVGLATLRARRAAPQVKVVVVVPTHLEVELAVPRIEHEARLLRRVRARLLREHDPLRQHEAPLELVRARRGAAAEVERRAATPHARPVGGRRGKRLRGRRRRRRLELLREPKGGVEALGPGTAAIALQERRDRRILRCDDEGMRQHAAARPHRVRRRKCDGRAATRIQARVDVIGGRVEGVLEHAPGIANDCTLMAHRLAPIAAPFEARVAVREGYAQAEAQRRAHADGQRVEGRMHGRGDIDARAIQGKGGMQRAGPEVEPLVDLRDVLCGDDGVLLILAAISPQEDAPEVEAVRVRAQVFDQRFRLVVCARRVHGGVAIDGEGLLLELVGTTPQQLPASCASPNAPWFAVAAPCTRLYH